MISISINGYPVTLTKNKRDRGWTASLPEDYPSPTGRPLFGNGAHELAALADLMRAAGWDDTVAQP